MKDKMKEMMEDKEKSTMSPKDVQAKRDILAELLAECDAELKGRASKGMDGMKVSVMADNPVNLKQGLEKAQELTKEMPEDMMESANKSVDKDQMDNSKVEDILEEAMAHDRKEPMMDEEESPEEEKSESPEDEDEEEQSFFQKKKSK